MARAIAGSDAAVPATGTVTGKGPYDCSVGGTSLFTDVSPSVSYCRHIHYVYAHGVTQGCTGTTYCPVNPVSRAQMSMFVARAMAGGDASVPTSGTVAATGRSWDCNVATPNLHFTDVAAASQYCRHAHYIWANAVVDGCIASPPQYCPANMVRRDQMAKFLTNAFQLKLYKP